MEKKECNEKINLKIVRLKKNILKKKTSARAGKKSAKKTETARAPFFKNIWRSRLRRRPKFCPAGENFENRGLFSRKSFRENVFRPGSRAPKTGFLGHLFLKSQKRRPFFVRQADYFLLFKKKCADFARRPRSHPRGMRNLKPRWRPGGAWPARAPRLGARAP